MDLVKSANDYFKMHIDWSLFVKKKFFLEMHRLAAYQVLW